MKPSGQRLQAFRAAVGERITRLNLEWIQLEQGRVESLAAFLRELHSLKGEAGLVGEQVLSGLAHVIEDLVAGAAATASWDKIGDRVLEGLDVMSALLVGGQEAITRAAMFLATAPAPTPMPAPTSSGITKLATSSGVAALAEAAAATSSGVMKLETPGAGVARGVEEATLSGVVRLADVTSALNTSAVATSPPPLLASLPARARLSVSSEHLERVRDTIGELLLARTRLTRTLGDLRRAGADAREVAAALGTGSPQLRAANLLADTIGGIEARLHDDSQQLGALVGELETSTRELRMTPIRELFDGFPVQVRNLARSLGREARLTVAGEDVEVDRTVMARLESPLAHLIRNAVDHGIAPPDERLAAGKPEEGEIQLRARLDRRTLVIEVSDDGNGIDLEAVRRRGRDLGLLEDDASEAQVLRCLFARGVSTRAQATAVSGRGIGLDAVMSALSALGGSVEVRTRAGQGTMFRISAPVTVALTSVLLFQVGLGQYAVPSEAVDGILDPAFFPILDGVEGPVVKMGDRRVRVLGLESVLEESPPAPPGGRILLLHSGDEQVALTGSLAHTQRDVVMKFGPVLERQALVAAAVPLESGALAWVLRVDALVGSEPVRGVAEAAHVRTILVVEDSPIVRDLVVEALRAYGARVLEAGDGEEAKQYFEGGAGEAEIDLVVTDLEMPRLDGLGLLRWLRARPGRRIPAVVLSMRGSDTDKQRAVQAGADAYLVKSDFSHGGLWSTIGRYLK